MDRLVHLIDIPRLQWAEMAQGSVLLIERLHTLQDKKDSHNKELLWSLRKLWSLLEQWRQRRWFGALLVGQEEEEEGAVVFVW